MALEATHIRFALEIKDRCCVRNLAPYVSGTIYPDSRYVTGVQRSLTHHDGLPKPTTTDDDFVKGWYVHIVCDRLQKKAMYLHLGEVMPDAPSDVWVKENWISETAIKIIQDIHDMQQFPVQEYLPLLDHVEARCGESLDQVRMFHMIFQHMYKKQTTTVEDCAVMWHSLGVSRELINDVKAEVDRLQRDPSVTETIHRLYGHMVAAVTPGML